jgi:drug/metabolite transporter (DMT)-like permease
MDLFIFSLPFLVLLLWTGSNSLIKKGLNDLGPDRISVFVVGMGLLPILVFVFLDGGWPFSPDVILLGVFSGVFLGTGYLLFYRGLGVESLSSTGVTLNVQQIIVIFIGIFFLKEEVNYFEYAGILLIILGAVLVTIQNAPAKRKFLIIAGIANVSWGIYYLPLSESILLIHYSALPLFLGRLIGFAFVLIISLNLKHPPEKARLKISSIYAGLLAGLLDGLGNVFYSYSIQLGVFIVSGAIVAMIPATLAVIGFLYFKDRMTSLKLSGIILSVTGALLISLL